MSRKSLQIISFIAFMATLTVAILGSSIMSEPGHMMVGCFGTTPSGNCSTLGPIQHYESHMNAFRSITSVVTGSIFVLLLSLLVALAVFLGINFGGDLRHRFAVRRFYDSVISYFVRIMHWLALHEKRDPSFAYAMNM